MLYIGCHLPSSKGYLAMGKHALSLDANTFAFFTRNPRGGSAKPIKESDVASFMKLYNENSFGTLVAHAPYTMNLCSSDPSIREFGRNMLADDMIRMEYTPNQYYNFHPGSHTGQGVETGIEQIADALNSILKPEQTTTCEQAEAIMQSLIDAGASDLVVSYNKWTNDGIKNKIDADAKASGTIGGKGDFEDLLAYAEDNGVALYPAVQNTGFESGNGYMTFKDTTIRVSGSYAREYTYNLAYGTQQTSKKPLSLITPTAYPEIFSDLADSCSDKGIKNIALSELTSALYGDYGKNLAGRDKAQDLLVESYETLSGSVDSILGNTANAYALPYVDRISNVPLQSSGYDIFDADIPFYQIVLHGLKSYSGTAVNGSADTNETVLRAVAAGSGIRYDMIGEETSILKDTELDNLYYAYYADWIEEAAQSYTFVKDVLAGTGDKLITGYEEEDGVIITTYEDGTVTVVDLEAESVTVNGTEYLLADYVKEGA